MFCRYAEEEAFRLPPLVLAYVGDAVFELYVRSWMTIEEVKVNRLHRRIINLVSAKAMAGYYIKLEPHLSTVECDVLHRGRNVKSHLIKSAGASEYHMSTGFEALVGYLFLSSQEERHEELLSFLMREEDGTAK